uniref:Synapse defective Rho GTPase homolog 1 n=1 Tax=Phasianus colchicus TaxID=9054 RepID=A0A669QDZ6_PHACC
MGRQREREETPISPRVPPPFPMEGSQRGSEVSPATQEPPQPGPEPLPDPEASSSPVSLEPSASRRQNWARFSSRHPPPRPTLEGLEPNEQDGTSSTPPSAADPPGDEPQEPVEEADAAELGGAGRSPGHGAYLQSLERSSRHWVLSSGKAAGLDETGGSVEMEVGAGGSEGEIWYNPIPEDEDPPKERREDEENPGNRGVEEAAAGRSQACAKMPIPCVSSASVLPPPSPPSSPGGSKKSRSLGKVKSPGTVRRLSMKMKKLPELRRKLSLRSPRPRGQEGSTSPSDPRKESSNVISRYHLDTSVASLPRTKATSKGGYLSDGDSPELPAKSGARDREEDGEKGLDVASFRPYSCGELQRGGQSISGLVNVHLYGVRDLKPPETGEVFCVLQVDGVNRARTALLPCKAAFLGLNHTFNLELEGAQLLKVIVFSWDPSSCRNRLCCHGAVLLPHIFRGSRAQQLAVQLQPRGVLFSKFTLVEQWEGAGERQPRVFGVELGQLVEREKTATKVPLLIQKCVAEIEKRGLKVVGLYRLCGSAAVKKELRDAFETDSAAVRLSEHLYPDINVITGILKDYLRELPTPLITPTLYHVVLEAMAKRPPRTPPGDAVALLDCLPDVEKVGAVSRAQWGPPQPPPPGGLLLFYVWIGDALQCSTFPSPTSRCCLSPESHPEHFGGFLQPQNLLRGAPHTSIFTDWGRVSSQPSFPKAQQPQLTQPFSIGEMLQALHHPCGPQLGSAQQIPAYFILGSPDLATILQMRLYQGRAEGKLSLSMGRGAASRERR